MCCKQLALIAILAVAATALPIAVPKTDGTAPINIDPAIQPEKIAIQSGEKTPIIAEKIPSTYADTGTVVGTKEEPKPYKTPAVDPIKPVDGQVVPEVDTKVQGEPAVVGDVSGTFRELPETEPKEEKVDPLPVPDSDKAPTLAVGDIDTKDPIEGPNLHKVEGVVDREGAHGAVVQDKVEGAKPYEAKVETAVVEEGVAVDDETTRDEKVPDGVEQYGSVLEFSKYDTNGDGVIDFDEWNIIHGGHEKITGQFHAADINGDKQLEQTEFHGATWYHDGGDVARDALMLAIAEQAASTGGGETNHAMTAAAMPSTEFRYIVDDAESSAQGVPVVPAEPVDVVSGRSSSYLGRRGTSACRSSSYYRRRGTSACRGSSYLGCRKTSACRGSSYLGCRKTSACRCGSYYRRRAASACRGSSYLGRRGSSACRGSSYHRRRTTSPCRTNEGKGGSSPGSGSGQRQDQNLCLSLYGLSFIIALTERHLKDTKASLRETLRCGAMVPKDDGQMAYSCKEVVTTLRRRLEETDEVSVITETYHRPSTTVNQQAGYGIPCSTKNITNHHLTAEFETRIEAPTQGVWNEVLFNTACFENLWRCPFNKRSTYVGSFLNNWTEKSAVCWALISAFSFQVTVLVMRKTSILPYSFYPDRQVDVVCLPYADDALCMTLIVQRSSCGSLSVLTPDDVKGFVHGAREMLLTLHLPKFHVSTPIDVGNLMTQIVCANSKDQWMRFLHARLEASITVEEGSWPVTYTEHVLSTGDPVTIIVDRPFHFVITDRTSDLILCMGRVMSLA
ncbi:hypothetical protein V5799_017211 [Amblyomma americanum]|uniref:EF-hand domain-containing protein n=1 Tax=Amblyomma americanum TaxID=6943 RepID=A0AAQ4F2W6_AMBAM